MKLQRSVKLKCNSVLAVLSMVLTLLILSAFTTEAEAGTGSVAQAPSVTKFAEKSKLVDANNFALYKEDTDTCVAQKVNFGKNDEKAQTWYIAGQDTDGSLVLVFDRLIRLYTDRHLMLIG